MSRRGAIALLSALLALACTASAAAADVTTAGSLRLAAVGSFATPTFYSDAAACTGGACDDRVGRVGRRALRPGRYREVLRATDAAGNRSRRRLVFFTVVRP